MPPRNRNQPNPFQGKVIYSILISVIIFLLCQFGLLNRELTSLDDQKLTLEAEIASKQRKLEEFQRQIWIKERDAYRVQRRYTQLNALTPPEFKMNSSNPNWLKPRGVAQRNLGLRWIRTNLIGGEGVVYFGDDDNTYDLKLFEEMRTTKGVSVWPVALVGGLLVERPLVDKDSGKVIDWMVGWKKERPFPIDMAGFAVNLKLILDHRDAMFTYKVARGYQESFFLEKLINVDQLEPKADLCSKVYVWHTRTEKPKLKNERLLMEKGFSSNQGIEI